MASSSPCKLDADCIVQISGHDLSKQFMNSFSAQPLTILGVTGPFSILAENIFSLCTTTFKVRECEGQMSGLPSD